jgi:hypothetical protein
MAVAGANGRRLTATAHSKLSKTVAANPLILQPSSWKVHKAFRLVQRAQLRLRQARRW